MLARRKRKKTKKERPCPICSQRNLGGGEIYVLRGRRGISIFDVAMAKQIIADGRSAQPIATGSLKKILETSFHEQIHLPHVDPASPGIVGQRVSGPFLLDGAHRAARCMKEGRVFNAFVLRPEETRTCLLAQDVGETDVGMAATALRELLANAPGSERIDVKMKSSSEAVAQIRKLLTPEENARIHIRIVSEASTESG